MPFNYKRGETPFDLSKIPAFVRKELEKIQRALIAPARTAVVIHTANLANNAFEKASVNTGMFTGTLLTITSSAAAWVRLYTSQAALNADAARALGATGSAGTGLLAEFNFSQAATIPVSPVATLTNDETPLQRRVWYAIENLSGAPAALAVTLELLATEP